jgi:hypothetical protein
MWIFQVQLLLACSDYLISSSAPIRTCIKEAGIISVRHIDGCHLPYQIMNPELVSDVLSKYKESFIDAVVNNYAHMVEEL